MKAKVQTRIDIDALRDIAGDMELACGQVYSRDGIAEIVWILQERIVVQVCGNQAFEIFGDCGDLQQRVFLTVFLTVLTESPEDIFHQFKGVFEQLLVEWE